MLRLPDDIEEFLITGQHRRAIHGLASRRCITPGQARNQVRARVFEMLIETGGDGTEPRAGNLEQVQAATGTRQHR